MSTKNPKDVSAELDYQARHAGDLQQVKATPPDVARLYREHKQWRTNAKQYIFHVIDEYRPATLCEFGCGLGETCTELALNGFQVFGFDLSPENIAVCRRRAELDGVTARTEFVVAAAGDTTLAGRQFDLVLVRAVLHHVDMEEGLASVAALVKPGGYALIQEPVAYSRTLQWFRDRAPVAKDISPNERQLNQRDMDQISASFEIVHAKHFYLLSRLIRLWPARDSASERVVFGWLNWLDYLLLKIPGVAHFAGQVVLLCKKRA